MYDQSRKLKAGIIANGFPGTTSIQNQLPYNTINLKHKIWMDCRQKHCGRIYIDRLAA